jgi:hypothetical protein
MADRVGIAPVFQLTALLVLIACFAAFFLKEKTLSAL